MFCTKHKDVGLDADTLELLYGVLGGLGLQLARSGEIGHVGQVYAHGVLAQLPLQLTDGLQEGLALDVAHRAADFGNHEVVLVLLAQIEHVALDFVGNVGNHLDGLAQIVAPTFLVDDALVDASRGEVVVAGGLYARKAFVMPQVQVSFLSVVGHIAFAVLVRVQRTRVDVDIRVELLDGNVVAACLQQLAD